VNPVDTCNSIYCILPPKVLRSIALNGSPDQRAAALDTLATDQTMRLTRASYQLMQVPSHTLDIAGAPPQKQRTIYDAHTADVLPGAIVRAEGAPAGQDPAINEAYDGLGATWDFYWQAYQRNSIDDQGLHLVASVHYKQGYDNAFWNGQQMVFGDGDGRLFNRFTIAVDVIGHELTHGVTGHEANLVYMGQPGALNESISDVFGSLVKQLRNNQTADQADWLIGAGLLTSGVHGTALRSMKAPGTAFDDPVLGKDDQPATMAGYVHTSQDNGGVHTNSGIPNHAFYLAAITIGGNAWEKAGHIWYETVRDPRLRKTASFALFAQLTVANAARLFGPTSAERRAVASAWQQVGVTIPGGAPAASEPVPAGAPGS
jgi:Zn-dependent metalloprotease